MNIFRVTHDPCRYQLGQLRGSLISLISDEVFIQLHIAGLCDAFGAHACFCEDRKYMLVHLFLDRLFDDVHERFGERQCW